MSLDVSTPSFGNVLLSVVSVVTVLLDELGAIKNHWLQQVQIELVNR